MVCSLPRPTSPSHFSIWNLFLQFQFIVKHASVQNKNIINFKMSTQWNASSWSVNCLVSIFSWLSLAIILPQRWLLCKVLDSVNYFLSRAIVVYIIMVYILYYNIGIPSMSKNCHPKTIYLVWLFLTMERQHSTRLAQAIHLGKETTFTILLWSVSCLLPLNPSLWLLGGWLTIQTITTPTILNHCVKCTSKSYL